DKFLLLIAGLILVFLGYLGQAHYRGVCAQSLLCKDFRLGLDLQGGLHLEVGITDPEFQNLPTEDKTHALNSIVSTLRTRVDLLGVAEPTLQVVGNRISIQLPGQGNFESMKSTIQRSAKLRFSFEAVKDEEFETLVGPQDNREYKIEKSSQIQGDDIVDAFVGWTEFNVPEVQLKMSHEGQKKFLEMTSPQNRGRLIAVILDDRIESFLQVGEPVGTQWVSIQFQGQRPAEELVEEASAMALVLKSGSLPYSIEILEERSVGPSLGVDQIRSSATAILISLILISVFMVFFYRLDGFIAVLALLVNLGGVLIGMSYLEASITLPGLAALVLTAGMSVDASIIIFERLKEIKPTGLSGDELIRESFGKVFSVLLDSYVTTALTGAILIYFGAGPIRGFGVVLILGIVNTFLAVGVIVYPVLQGFAKLKIGLTAD
ncbi:MAG: protein translocase subunit SecD, partial [Bdellovibrionales bacterium]|nr:protein translocase subunit SecD [Bdellovibrionales bacterium]